MFILSNHFVHFVPKAVFTILTNTLHRYNGKFKNKQTLTTIGTIALELGMKHELQILIANALKSELSFDFQILNSLILHSKDMLSNYLANLVSAMQVFPDPKLKVIFAYNNANFYRSQSEKYWKISNRFGSILMVALPGGIRQFTMGLTVIYLLIFVVLITCPPVQKP